MDYTIKAIETKFKDFVFRSRLEAKWAVMFELLGWRWDYEPIDFNGWIPDFAIYGTRTFYVEVKPVVNFPNDVAAKMHKSGCTDPMIILGQNCLLRNHDDSSYCDGLYFGWVTEWTDELDEHEPCDPPWWEPATFGRWEKANGKIGFCHSVGAFVDGISGGYDGGHFGSSEVTGDEIRKLWAMSHNAIRFTPKPSKPEITVAELAAEINRLRAERSSNE